jgi:sensor domain CHASE-containing protein
MLKRLALLPSLLARAPLTWLALTALPALGSFALWDPTDLDERNRLRPLVRQEVQSVHEDLASDMRSRLSVLPLLAEVCTVEDTRSLTDCSTLAKWILDQDASLLRLESLDGDHRPRWALDRGGTGQWRPLSGARTLSLPDATHVDTVLIVPQARVEDGRSVLSVLVPVRGPRPTWAFLVLVMDARGALEGMLSDDAGLGYSVSVKQGSDELYRTPGSGDMDARLTEEMTLQLPGVQWHIRVWPNAATLADLRSSLPEAGVALGATMALLLMVALASGRAARRRSHEARQIQQHL